jgi:putative tryptophan/tyrosine transport system substrate-binding protein
VTRRGLLLLLAGAMTAPRAPHAQQKTVPVIGLLISSPGTKPAFQQGLSEVGYDWGQNVVIVYRNAEGQYDQLPSMAADLVRRSVALIAAFGLPAALAAKRASSTIPVVFVSGDPVEEGLVASLARPGGNLTGFSLIDAELGPKRLELLCESIPQARVFALLVNPEAANADAVIRNTQDAARAKGVELHVLTATTAPDFDAAFATLHDLHVGALVIDDDQFFTSSHSYLVALELRHAIPAIHGWSGFAWDGGLISYGPNRDATYRQMGIYAGRILKGEKPADLPVQQPTTFELVVNLKTARALGLNVPPSILGRADEVIE